MRKNNKIVIIVLYNNNINNNRKGGGEKVEKFENTQLLLKMFLKKEQKN